MATAVGRAVVYEETWEMLYRNSEYGSAFLHHLYVVLEEDFYFFIANEVTLLLITNRGIFDAVVFLSRSKTLKQLISALYHKLFRSS